MNNAMEMITGKVAGFNVTELLSGQQLTMPAAETLAPYEYKFYRKQTLND